MHRTGRAMPVRLARIPGRYSNPPPDTQLRQADCSNPSHRPVLSRCMFASELQRAARFEETMEKLFHIEVRSRVFLGPLFLSFGRTCHTGQPLHA